MPITQNLQNDSNAKIFLPLSCIKGSVRLLWELEGFIVIFCFDTKLPKGEIVYVFVQVQSFVPFLTSLMHHIYKGLIKFPINFKQL